MHNESDAKTHRTPKALRAKSTETPLEFRVSFGECPRVLASLLGSAARSSHAHFSRGVSGIATPEWRRIRWALRLIWRPCRGWMVFYGRRRWFAPPA